MLNMVRILLLVLQTKSVLPISKCCGFDQFLTYNETNYFCKSGKRIQFLTDRSDFLGNRSDGVCHDGNQNNVIKYKIHNYTVLEHEQISVEFFRKCCPLNFFYHSISHSCVFQTELDTSFIKKEFVKVGLPDCFLILDHALNQYQINSEELITGKYRYAKDDFCLDLNEDQVLVARGCHKNEEICSGGVKCLRKCCPDGQSYVNGKTCLDTYIHGLNLSFTNSVRNQKDPFAIIHNYDCSRSKNRSFILENHVYYYVDSTGLFYVYYNSTNSFKEYKLHEKFYCIEHIKRGEINEFKFLMCREPEIVAEKFVAARWAKIVSCVFIILTILVYCFLPKMLNLFGRILISYCFSVLFLFILLVYIQFPRDYANECLWIGLGISYASHASFSWMNVMSYDLWSSLSNLKTHNWKLQNKDMIWRFLLYSVYAWGIPGLLTVVIFVAHSGFDTPDVIKPLLGSSKCSWEKKAGNYGMLIFYIFPLIIMEIINLILFFKTIFYCTKVSNEITRRNASTKSLKRRENLLKADKAQFCLIIKLGILMGVSFVFEIVSLIFNFDHNKITRYIEVVWDFINCLQGVFIFLIFVCKRKHFTLIRTKISTHSFKVTTTDSFKLTSFKRAQET